MIAYTTQDILSWCYNHDTEAFEKLQYSCYEPFIVIVDYLQIVADSNNSNRKTSTDNMMSTFKNLSLDMEVPVICISSIGREGYGKRIALDSFKESGNIEFGAGVCLWLTQFVKEVQEPIFHSRKY